MIVPTPGRIVWYRPVGADPAADAHAAIVVGIHDPHTVNLAIFNVDGAHYQGTAVPLLQDGDTPPADKGYAEWMPFQKGQAAKYDGTAAQPAAASAAAAAPDFSALEKALDAKLQELCDWLVKKFAEVDGRLTALTMPPAGPPPLAVHTAQVAP